MVKAPAADAGAEHEVEMDGSAPGAPWAILHDAI